MKFSIVTPSYNQGRFIEQTIQSVISQEGDFEIEYIIADGGSCDNSVGIIKKYDRLIKRKQYPIKCNGIKYIWWSKKDKGQAMAINKGIFQATGDIIAYLNSDDIYISGTLEKVAKMFISNSDKAWLSGYCKIIDEKGCEIQKPIKHYKNWWLKRYSYSKLCITNFIAQPATFWKRSIHDKIGYFDENLHFAMDYDFWLRCANRYNPIMLPSEISCFRIHTLSKGGRGFSKQFDEDLNIVSEHSNIKYLVAVHQIHNRLIKYIYAFIK